MKSQQQFLNLMDKHKGILHKITRMYMDDPEDREDLLQEIILQLWKSYERFEGGAQFSTWMYRVSLNTALTYFKKERRKPEQVAIQADFERVAEEYCGEKDFQLQLFYRAVQELSKVEKALIFLFLEGQSHKEIGSNLGIAEGNARVKLNRTKDKLQTIIKSYGYEF